MSMMNCVKCSRSIDTDFNAESCDSGECICPHCEDKIREETLQAYREFENRLFEKRNDSVIGEFINAITGETHV